ncbi:TRAF family member-associated NF-kappa-B activator-like [Spea bombifrons]|uniref:TRAF family member-associated NF-kappa-B activator-like n=1 Tax=Spea bombifrons TaxID=233779 RepID=UPI00234BF7C7|nr:TRAF family member-associated NF-kappa-B activator-like [Spea bombifrons]
MEEAFLSLYQEFQVLQSICTRQAKLLRMLLAKKEIISDVPISKPIQCSDVDESSSKKGAFFNLNAKENEFTEALKSRTNDFPTPKLLKPSEDSAVLEPCVPFPSIKKNHSLPSSENEKVELAVDFSKLKYGDDKRKSKTDLELFIKNYTPQFQNAIATGDESICGPTTIDVDFLFGIKADQNFSLCNSYEDLCYLHSKDISFGECLAPENRSSTAVRGPAQSSWTPGCLSGEYHIPNSDVGLSSQICEFCQAIFPAGTATEGDYLRHLMGHVE